MSDILYLKFEKNSSVRILSVTLGDVAELECTNTDILNRLKTLKLFSFQNIKKGAHTCAAREVVSVLDVVQKIHTIYPKLEVQNLGETDFIVEYSTKGKDPAWLLTLKVGLVCVISFCGSVFSIMAFHNDIAINELIPQFYELVMGEPPQGFTILELAYSLGLSVGIVTFFNHFGKRRLTKDPTPIEVEMREYEDSVDTALIQTAGRNGDHKNET